MRHLQLLVLLVLLLLVAVVTQANAWSLTNERNESDHSHEGLPIPEKDLARLASALGQR